MIAFEANELQVLLETEQKYIDELKARWGGMELSVKSEHYLRMGKRTELLGNLHTEKNAPLCS